MVALVVVVRRFVAALFVVADDDCCCCVADVTAVAAAAADARHSLLSVSDVRFALGCHCAADDVALPPLQDSHCAAPSRTHSMWMWVAAGCSCRQRCRCCLTWRRDDDDAAS